MQNDREKPKISSGTADRQSGLEWQADAKIQRLYEAVGEEGSAFLSNGPREADGTGTAGEDIEAQVSKLFVRQHESREAPLRARIVRALRLRESSIRRGAEEKRRRHCCER